MPRKSEISTPITVGQEISGNGAMTQPAQVGPYWLQSGGGMAECDTGPT